MVFVDIRGQPTEDERDLITQLWELNMINAFNIEAQRFPIAPNRSVYKPYRIFSTRIITGDGYKVQKGPSKRYIGVT